jgi:hypothetical protein
MSHSIVMFTNPVFETDDLQYRVIMTLISLQVHLMVASMIDYFTPTRSGDTYYFIDDR